MTTRSRLLVAVAAALALTTSAATARDATAESVFAPQLPALERDAAPSIAAARPRPHRRLRPLPLRETCVTRAERRRIVRFTALDRVRLIGVELGGGPRAVVLAHQGGGASPDLCSWLPYGRTLAAAGYRVLVFDHRGFGSSGQTGHYARATRVDFDVLAAIHALRGRGATSFVLAGASLGGSAVLSAAVHAVPAVNGVISFASPQTFGRVDALAAVKAFRVPVLFLSAEGDDPFPEDARALYEASPSPDKRLAIFPGFDHGAPVLRDPAVKQLVDGWIRAHLPG